jgi:hypothetical protein
MMIRGWSAFGDREAGRNGLSREEAQKMADGVVADLPADMRALVEVPQPFHRNWQITLRFQADLPSEDCWTVFKEVKRICEGIKIRDKSIYCIMESPPWKVIANRHMRSAGQAFRECLNKPCELTLDWKQSQVWVSKIGTETVDAMIGHEHRASCTWCFNWVALEKLGLAREAIQRAFDNAL